MPDAAEFPPIFPPIEDLIPHKPPVRLLDAITAVSESGLNARASITRPCANTQNQNSAFWTRQGLPACTGLEYLGQAAAAFFSMLELQATHGSQPKSPPAPGMLIASRSYSCVAGYFPQECTLDVAVTLTSPVGPSGLVKFSGSISLSDSPDFSAGVSAGVFAQGDLSVYLPPR